MDIGEVIAIINNSFHHCSFLKYSSTASLPRIVNLLNTNKKEKEDAVKQSYNRFVKYNEETIVLLSVCTSSHLFQWIITHATQVCFWLGRVCVSDKRVELVVVSFSNIQFKF